MNHLSAPSGAAPLSKGLAMSRYLQHITLQTGDVRRSPRSEVEEDVVARLRETLAHATQGDVSMPGLPELRLKVSREGKCALATIYTADEVPLITIGVAGRSTGSKALWRIMHEHPDVHELATDPERPPPTPWCADRLEPGIVLRMDITEWTGDFARCLAWALLSPDDG